MFASLLRNETGVLRSCLIFLFVASAAVTNSAAAEPEAESATERPVVILETSAGDISIELFPDRAPNTVANFLRYVDAGFYDGLVFHRVIPGRLIQSGLVDINLQERERFDKIKSESDNGIMNDAGTVSMDRLPTLVHSATSEFFINLRNNDKFNRRGRTASLAGYAVFGRITSGLEVAKHIGAVRSEQRGELTRFPLDPTTITRAYRKAAEPVSSQP